MAMAIRAASLASLVPLAMLAFGATIVYRTLRMGVDADEHGLVVRNGLRARRYSWHDIEDFRLGRPSGMPVGHVLFEALHTQR